MNRIRTVQTLNPRTPQLLRYGSICLVAVGLHLLSAPASAQDHCEGLSPRGGEEVSESFKGAISGQVEGVVAKLAGGSASIEGEYVRLESDTLRDYPEANKIFVWQSIIYLACVRPEAGIDINKLFELYLNGPPSNAAEKACSFKVDPRAAEFTPPAVKNSLGPISGFLRKTTIGGLIAEGNYAETLQNAERAYQSATLVSGPYSQEGYIAADMYAQTLVEYGSSGAHGQALQVLRNKYGIDIGTHGCIEEFQSAGDSS